MANQKSNQIPPWLTEVKEDAIRTNVKTKLNQYNILKKLISRFHQFY